MLSSLEGFDYTADRVEKMAHEKLNLSGCLTSLSHSNKWSLDSWWGSLEGAFLEFSAPARDIAQHGESGQGICVQSEAISNHHNCLRA
jgi:hypothetical protein